MVVLVTEPVERPPEHALLLVERPCRATRCFSRVPLNARCTGTCHRGLAFGAKNHPPLTSMHIAQIPPLAESVPPKLYGGTERVVSWLTEELVMLGHEVTLFGTGDSVTSGRLVPIIPHAIRLSRPRPEPFPAYAAQLDALANAAGEFDIIHCHTDWIHLPLTYLGVPHVTTIHNRLDTPDLPAVVRRFPNPPLISISDHHRTPLPSANWLEPISKLPEEYNEASELDKAEEVLGVVLPAHEDAALPLNPGEEALDEPASRLTAEPSSILRGHLAVGAMWRNHLDAVASQLLVQGIAVVGAVADQILRLGFDHVEVEAELHQAHFVMVGRMRADRKWQAMAIDDRHDFHTFSAPRRSDFGPATFCHHERRLDEAFLFVERTRVAKRIGNIGQHPTQNLIATPCLKAPMHGLVVRIALRKHVPLCACVEDPQDGFQHTTAWDRLSPGTPIRDVLFRKMLPDAFPLIVRKPNHQPFITDRPQSAILR